MRTLSDLRPYQQRGVTALYESRGLLAILPIGAGKTAMALTAAAELLADGEIRTGLVIAPKRVANLTWPDEIAAWAHTYNLTFNVLNGTPEERLTQLRESEEDGVDLIIIGVDHTQWLCEQLDKLPDGHPIFDLLVIDEISRFRDPKSKRAKALMSHARRFKTIWGLTGTPRPNGYEDLFKPLQIVTRERLWGRSFYKWQGERFYPTDRKGYDWAIKPDWEERTLAEAGTVSLTIDVADMPEMPEVSVITHYVDLPGDVRRQYKKMERELFAKANGRDILAVSAGVASGKLAQMVQGFVYGEGGNQDAERLHSLKEEWIAELVESLAGSPAIVIYEFQEDVHRLRELFPDIAYIGPGVGEAETRRIIEAWNRGEVPLMTMHAASGGHGLNLQFGGSQFIWYGLTWSAELYEQAIGRLVRPGQQHKCFIHICLARQTIDEMKRMRVIEKMSAQEAFTRYLETI